MIDHDIDKKKSNNRSVGHPSILRHNGKTTTTIERSLKATQQKKILYVIEVKTDKREPFGLAPH